MCGSFRRAWLYGVPSWESAKRIARTAAGLRAAPTLSTQSWWSVRCCSAGIRSVSGGGSAGQPSGANTGCDRSAAIGRGGAGAGGEVDGGVSGAALGGCVVGGCVVGGCVVGGCALRGALVGVDAGGAAAAGAKPRGPNAATSAAGEK